MREIGNAPPAPFEQLSSVHDETLKVLMDSHGQLGAVLRKVRGLHPEPDPPNEKDPEKHLLNDAGKIRQLAHGILHRAEELHRLLGYDEAKGGAGQRIA